MTTMFLMVTVIAGLVTVQTAQAAGQTMPADKGQPARAATDGNKPITVTGCVAQSGAVYRLDHAIVATDPDVDTQNRPGTEARANPEMVSYLLIGSDPKAHLGHKVEVAGTLSNDKPSKDTAGIKEAPGMKLAGTLNVKSLKMVGAACP